MAINKLLLGASGSDTSDVDEDHIILHDEIVTDSDDTASSLSTVESFESFASASMGELDGPMFTDPESWNCLLYEWGKSGPKFWAVT